jgi:hypothetical protein
MRVIGQLPDARMKITVFANDGRFPVQFEQAGLSQIYRFRKTEGLAHLGDVKQYIDEPFRQAVLRQFTHMRQLHQTVLRRLAPDHQPTDDLPDIL